MNKITKSKVIGLFVWLTLGLLSVNALAQEDSKQGGLFNWSGKFDSDGLFRSGESSGIYGGITNQDFQAPTAGSNGGGGGGGGVVIIGGGGDDAPLGTGIAILISAGLGYIALKKKEEKQ